MTTQKILIKNVFYFVLLVLFLRFNGISTFVVSFNAKAILLEEWCYSTHSLGDMEVHACRLEYSYNIVTPCLNG